MLNLQAEFLLLRIFRPSVLNQATSHLTSCSARCGPFASVECLFNRSSCEDEIIDTIQKQHMEMEKGKPDYAGMVQVASSFRMPVCIADLKASMA